MAEWTRADVIAIAPEFAAVDPAVLDAYVARAMPQVNPDAFGDNTIFAGALLTAHLLTRFPPAGVTVDAGPVGPVTSETVGQVSVSYAAPQLNAAMMRATLATTKYGIEFDSLIKIACFTPSVL